MIQAFLNSYGEVIELESFVHVNRQTQKSLKDLDLFIPALMNSGRAGGRRHFRPLSMNQKHTTLMVRGFCLDVGWVFFFLPQKGNAFFFKLTETHSKISWDNFQECKARGHLQGSPASSMSPQWLCFCVELPQHQCRQQHLLTPLLQDHGEKLSAWSLI